MVSAKLPATFLILWGMWIVLTLSLDPYELLVGAIAAAFVSALSYSLLFRTGIKEKLSPTRFGYFLAYIPSYILAEIKSHWDVIKRIVNPRMPINPGIVKIKTGLKTDLGLTGLANAITMTPGTLTVEIVEEEPCLYIHWIDVQTTDPEQASKAIGGGFEKYLRRIFG
ncbi:MAG: Na+/H+ antiporter subunit E [Candidatus Hadarchaeum sp.]